MADLADRISRGAVAALDLAPFDERFSKLSRLVLTGGASRFAAVVVPEEPIQYVVPVGLPHERIEYGALLVQASRVGLVWRDSSSHDRTRVVRLDPASPPTYSSLELGGEEWTRIDLEADDPEAAFLVPPVTSPNLRTTLISLLRARPAGAPSEPEAPAERTALSPAPAPVPTPAPSPAAVSTPPPPAPSPAPVPSAAPAPPVGTDPDATQPMAAIEDDPEATRVRPAVRRVPSPAPDDSATMMLYRDEASAQQPTQAMTPNPPRPTPAPAATSTYPQASATPPPPPAPVSRTGSGSPAVVTAQPSQTVRGFLIGLSATLIVGLLIIIVVLLTR